MTELNSNIGAEVSKELVINMIREIAVNGEVSALDENTFLFEEGILDSFSIVNLIGEIEDRFGIKLESEDLITQNFENVKGLMSLLAKYRKS